jgi:hypothetical protein
MRDERHHHHHAYDPSAVGLGSDCERRHYHRTGSILRDEESLLLTQRWFVLGDTFCWIH